MDRKQNQGEKMVERMNINNINENKYPISQAFDPDSKDNNGQYSDYRNGFNLNDDICDKDE